LGFAPLKYYTRKNAEPEQRGDCSSRGGGNPTEEDEAEMMEKKTAFLESPSPQKRPIV